MSDVPNYWWNNTIPEEPATITEQTLRDAMAAMENEANVVAERRAQRSIALAAWWKAQPEAVRESKAGQMALAYAEQDFPMNGATYRRLEAAITELGGTMP